MSRTRIDVSGIVHCQGYGTLRPSQASDLFTVRTAAEGGEAAAEPGSNDRPVVTPETWQVLMVGSCV